MQQEMYQEMRQEAHLEVDLDAGLKKDSCLQETNETIRKPGTSPSRVNYSLLSFFFVFLLYLTPLSLHAVTVPAGDVAPYGAPDGLLNAADAFILQRFVLGDLIPTADELLICDVAPLGAPDGSLNAADLLVLTRAILGDIVLNPVTLIPVAPTLAGTDTTTNNNPYSITGTATPGIDVNLYINGQQRATTTAAAGDGSFSFAAALFDGFNTIYVTAWDGADESVPSANTLTIEYINNIPRTQNGGTISTNVVWTPGELSSPYIINGEIIIANGASLTILPGAVLEFDVSGYITVNGTLNVQGTLAEKVRFTAIDPATNNWNGMVINASATDVVIDHAIIEYAGTGLFFDNSTGTVTNSEIRNNTIGIDVYNIGATPLITGTIIRDNDQGINVRGNGIAGGNPNPVVTGNWIFDNINTGSKTANYVADSFYDASNTILVATGNWWGSEDPGFIAQTITDYSDDSGNPATSPLVDYSGFVNVEGSPVAINALYLIDGAVTLDVNTVYTALGNIIIEIGESLTIPFGVTILVPGNFEITVNGALDVVGNATDKVTFTSGKSTPAAGDWKGILINSTATASIDYAVIEYANEGVHFNNVGGTLSNSLIQNNNTGINSSGIGATPLITGNSIQNNLGTGGIVVSNKSAPQVMDNTIAGNFTGINVSGTGAAGGETNPLVTGNRIYSNDYQNYTATGYYDPSHTVLNATDNWWGSTDPRLIAESILDNTDNAGAPYVDYSDFLDEDGIPVAINALYVIDGVVSLTAGMTYTALGDITIETGESLTIPAGVTILIPGGYEIIVNGILDVEGSESARVVFTPSYYEVTPGNWVPYNWKGIVVNTTAMVDIDHAVIEHSSKGGVSFMDADGTLSNSLLQYNATGIYLEGDSSPSLLNNTIINNGLYGIHLKGSGVDAGNPQPIINGNDIYSNPVQLYIENYGESSSVVINMTGNWWGTDTPTAGAGGEIQFGSNMPLTMPEAVTDYSTPLTSTGQGPIMISSAFSLMYISPGNNDGIQDTTTFSGALTEAADSWTVTVRNDAVGIVRTFPAGSGSSVNVNWDGTNDSGIMQGDGNYYFLVSATASGKTSQSGFHRAILDNSPPYDVVASIDEPDYINYTNVKVTFTVKGAYQMKQSELADFSDASWASILLPPSYTFSQTEGTRDLYVKFKDQAGNETLTSDSVVLDFTPPVIAVTSPEEGEIF